MVIEPMDDAMVAVLRSKTPAQRLAMVCELSEFLRIGLRRILAQQHPDWTRQQIQREVLRRCLNEPG
jgi:hypothetical protein